MYMYFNSHTFKIKNIKKMIKNITNNIFFKYIYI